MSSTSFGMLLPFHFKPLTPYDLLHTTTNPTDLKKKNAELTQSFATAYKTLLGKSTNIWSALRRTLQIDRLGLLVEHRSSSRPVKKTKKVVCEENAPFHFI